MDDLARLTLDLGVVPQRSTKIVGAILGKGADDIRDAGRSEARGKGWSKDTVEGIYSRRERSGDPAGYVFLKGPAAWQEAGTSRHPAQPVVSQHFDRFTDAIAEEIADAVADLL